MAGCIVVHSGPALATFV